MPRYADPAACPDCGGPIGRGTSRCPRCGLALTGPTAVELFWALQRADELLATLRADSAPAAATAAAGGTGSAEPAEPRIAPVAPAAPPAPAAAPPVAAAPSHHPIPSAPVGAVTARSRLSGASVPRILLGLGALCLVVAALVFMAVTWARLGVGGRTIVLLVATAVAGAASTWTRRRSLPAASEALTVVTVALAALDAFGAVDAGWLGDLDGGATTVVVGLVVAAVSLALGVLHEVAADRVGVAEQLLVALGCTQVAVGALVRTDRTSLVLAVATTVLLALSYAARRARLRPGALALLGAAVASGLGLLLTGLQDVGTQPLTFSHTILHGGSADLLVLAVLGIVAASLRDLPARDRTTAAVLGLGLLALALTAFLLDEGPTGVGVTSVGLAVLAGLAALAATGVWRPALRLLAVLATLVALVVALGLAALGADRFHEAHRWLAESATTPAAAHTAPDRWVALLVVPPLAVLALAAAAAPTRRWLRDRRRRLLAGVLGAAAVAGYAVAVVVPTPLVVLTAVAGTASVSAALTSGRLGGRAHVAAVGAAHLLGLTALAVSYPSSALVLAGSLLWAVACALLVLGPVTGPAGSGGWTAWTGTTVWVLLAVPLTLAVRDWASPVAAAVVVAAGAVLVAAGAALVRRTGTAAEVAAGLAAAVGALSASAVTWDEPSGAAVTWAGVALALGAAAAARAAGPDAPAATHVPAGSGSSAVATAPTALPAFRPRMLLVLVMATAVVVALMAAGPAVFATVERVLGPGAWTRSWRDRLPTLAEVPSGVGSTEQAALVGALIGVLLALLLLVVSGVPRMTEPARAATRRRAALAEVGWPAAAAVLTVLSWMFLPSRALVVAAAVGLAAATLLGMARASGSWGADGSAGSGGVVGAVGAVGAPVRRTPFSSALVGVALLAGGTLAALPSQVLFVVATGVVTAALAWLTWRGQAAWAAPAAVLAGAVCLVSGGLAAGLPQAWSAAPVLAVTAVAVVAGALLRRTWESLEVAFTVAAVGAAFVAVADAGSTGLAAHLAVVGALAAGHGAAHPDRRPFAWAGSVLLAGSTWVRLADADVTVVEAYTLPSALALVVLGAWRLRTDQSLTSQRALGTGLVLATVPSLPQVWVDPVSLRALLVGLGCLVLVLAGAGRHLAAPLLVGAAAGTVVALAEVWPVIGSGPQWVPLTAAGVLLLVCGATWEARLRDLRRAGAYLTALR